MALRKKRRGSEGTTSNGTEKKVRRSTRIAKNNVVSTSSDFVETPKKSTIPPDIEVIVIPSRTPSPPPTASHEVHTVDEISNSDVRKDTIGIANEHRDANLACIRARVPYDVCFGLLLLHISSTYIEENPPPEVAPLQVSLFGDMLSFRYEDKGGQAGFLVSEALSQLLRECSVTLAATIGSPTTYRSSESAALSLRDVKTRPLRVLVYGLLSEKDAVTKILDKGGLFLQRPGACGYDRRVKYFNPMYLLRPGENMPRDSGFSGPGDREESVGSTEETHQHEVVRGMALAIFDEANGSDARTLSNLKQSPRIISKLKDHQLEALSMMVERENGPLNGKWRFPCLWEESTEEGKTVYRHAVTKSIQSLPLPILHGGILADDMGLGKTLSTIALICYHLDSISRPTSTRPNSVPRTSLIVTPKSTIYGWQQQLERHVRPGEIRSFVYHGPGRQDASNQLDTFDVVLTTYDTLRSDWKVDGLLYKYTWARIILDEAHKIRNYTSATFHATCQIRAENRWCLTGTPIQNSLNDYGSLLAFIGIPPFVTLDQFKFWISSPIQSSSHGTSFVPLRKLVRATCLRRTKATPHLSAALKLTKKTETVEVIELAPKEREVYEFFKRRSYLLLNKGPNNTKPKAAGGTKYRRRVTDTDTEATEATPRKNSGSIIVLISVLRMICNHAEALLPAIALDAWRGRDSDSVSWALLQKVAQEDRTCCVCKAKLNGSEKSQTEVVEFSCAKHVACEACVDDTTTAGPACPQCSPTKKASPSGVVTPPPSSCLSSKISTLVRNVFSTLEVDESGGEASPPVKSVIFSQWTRMLNLISDALGPRLSSLGFSFVRIDGSSTLQQRRGALEKFNSDRNCVIMLATIGAVNEGIDLSVASETHIVEPHWNPMAEAQAVDRVHRIGQTRDVKITRYCVKDSVEEYIQWVQARKTRLISESLSSSDKGPGEKDEEALAEERWQRLLEYLK